MLFRRGMFTVEGLCSRNSPLRTVTWFVAVSKLFPVVVLSLLDFRPGRPDASTTSLCAFANKGDCLSAEFIENLETNCILWIETMHWVFQIFIAANFVLFCEGGFIPFKRSFSTDPDVGRNVVSGIIVKHALLDKRVLAVRLMTVEYGTFQKKEDIWHIYEQCTLTVLSYCQLHSVLYSRFTRTTNIYFGLDFFYVKN